MGEDTFRLPVIPKDQRGSKRWYDIFVHRGAVQVWHNAGFWGELCTTLQRRASSSHCSELEQDAKLCDFCKDSRSHLLQRGTTYGKNSIDKNMTAIVEHQALFEQLHPSRGSTREEWKARTTHLSTPSRQPPSPIQEPRSPVAPGAGSRPLASPSGPAPSPRSCRSSTVQARLRERSACMARKGPSPR